MIRKYFLGGVNSGLSPTKSHLYCFLFALFALPPFSCTLGWISTPCVVENELELLISCFYLLNPVITEPFHLAGILCSAGYQTQDFYLHSQPKAFSKVVVLGKLRQENHTFKVNLSQTLSLNKTNLKKKFSYHFVLDSHFPHSVIKIRYYFTH